jgi:uncharacterized membrane protein YeaQ/YmgE (transglycosylase-associated protein family)
MRDPVRKEAARKLAEGYAPRPQDGFVMYAVVGVLLAGLALFTFGQFYNFDFSFHPLLAVTVLAAGCIGALVLLTVRRRRHNAAHRREYDKEPD